MRMIGATRRQILVGLTRVLPVALFSSAAGAAALEAEDDFLWASRVIAGSEALSSGVAARIRDLLAARIDGFDASLERLVATMRAAGSDRAAMIAGLDDAQVAFALRIAEPWYLGHVGTPSDFVLDDDAAFASFLEAQAWDKIADVVPRITYPGHGPAWWDATPPGVAAPPMQSEILDWTRHPDGPAAILPPDPAWRAFAIADHADLDAARTARPGR